MNEHDSEVLAGILQDMGYAKTEKMAEADVVLVNTCCVRESAERRILGELGRLKQYQDRRPDMLIGVCGCLPMQEGSRDRIRQRASHVDLAFGTGNLHRLPYLLQKAKNSEETVWETQAEEDTLPSALPRLRTEGVRAWVPIIYGCDNYCAYCTVPHVRGRERSRPPREIRREVEKLVSEGVRQVTLLGQNVNSYGKDLKEHQSMDFGQLLRSLDEIDGLIWIHYTTSHPRDFSHQLVDTIAGLDKVGEHFHLPVQSGSDRILRMMNRGYSRDEYLDLVQYIGRVFPDASITTDVIVGFPGETEEDFLQTYELFRRVRFDGAFSFMYSPRPQTAAAEFSDQVPQDVKQERLQRLNELQQEISLERNGVLQDQVVTVLVEGPSKRNGSVLKGRTRTNKLVLFEEDERLVGRFVRVKITEVQPFQLFGSAVGEVKPAAQSACKNG